MCLSDLENNHLKADIKKEKNQKSPVKDQKLEATLAQQNRLEKSPCDVCREKKLQISTTYGEKSVIALSSLFAKDLTEKQKSWSVGGKIQTEAESKAAPCKGHERALKGGAGPGSEGALPSEASLQPPGRQWHDVNIFLGLAGSTPRRPEKLPADGDPEGRAEPLCCQQSEGCLGAGALCDSKCCHPSDFVVEAPGHMSDTEWMNIFKPSKVQRIVRHKSVCTCSGSLSGAQYSSSASELIAIQHSHCLGSSKSALRDEDTEAPSDKKNSSKGLLIGRDVVLANEKDDFSPTSKLQRLLAESRQMVTNLELNTLLPISGESLDASGADGSCNLEVSEESAQKNGSGSD